MGFQLFFYCLHPPEGTFALLGVISKANLNFILSPVLLGSVVLVILGISFNPIFNKYLHVQFIGFKYYLKII